jgi:hypothetical protein
MVNEVPFPRWFKVGFLGFVLLQAIGCIPDRGTTPARTWRPEEPETKCEPQEILDPQSSRWSRTSAGALASKAERSEAVVVSAIGCNVEVLDRCRSSARYRKSADGYELTSNGVSAKTLEGECAGATHVVRTIAMKPPVGDHEARPDGERATPRRVELAALSLDDFRLTGVWKGVMRQPHGPYEVYDVTMELAQDGDRVRGITRVTTVDNAYWGDLRFEGRLEGTTLFFHDAEIIDDNLGIFLAWCTKGGYMLVDPREERLRGPWRASFCMPGTVDVHFLGEKKPLHPGAPIAQLPSTVR